LERKKAMSVAGSATRTDAVIRQDVLAELDWDLRVPPDQIAVAVADGVVTLSGAVDSLAQRWAAQQAAFRVLGVRAIANDIEVRIPHAATRPDTDLAQAVVTALQWDAEVPTSGIQVTVSDGWVTLSGSVDTAFQRQRAARAVHHLIGVKGVNDLLTVRAPQPAPADVRQRIERALLRNAETDAQHIQVEVKDHTVILRGQVHSYAEFLAAEGSAFSAPGITEVDNRLMITI
jgi:osmotically-inducible protein OsmY